MFANPTKSEVVFRKRLAVAGIRFVFQQVIGFYIVDFLLPDYGVVIEVDGWSHDASKDYDRRRDAWIQQMGFRTIRVRNEDVETFDLKSLVRVSMDAEMLLRRANSLVWQPKSPTFKMRVNPSKPKHKPKPRKVKVIKRAK